MKNTAAIMLAALTIGMPLAHADPAQCYQKLLYQICTGPDGGWTVNPTPALPLPGPPSPPPPIAGSD